VVGDAGRRPFVRARFVGGAEKAVPHRQQDAEIAVEVTALRRVVDAMEPVVDQHRPKRPEVSADRRVNVIFEELTAADDDERQGRRIKADDAQRDRDQ
jgi:hypothetical protein